MALVGLAFAILLVGHLQTQRRKRAAAAGKGGVRGADAAAAVPKVLVHAINDDRCTGCDACVVVCPTNVLELVSNKSRVLRFGDCIQCVQCMLACPTTALVMHWEDTEPPPIKVPNVDPYYQTEVGGMYLIGEVAGKPLVKNAANAGRAVVEHMLQNGLQGGAAGRRAEGSDARSVEVVDVVIVGSGPGGLSAALTCINQRLTYVVLEKDQLIASTIARYPKGKDVMAEPYDVKNLSHLPVFDSRKEEIIPIWSDLIDQTGMRIQRGEAVESVTKTSDGLFDVRTTVAAYRAQRVVLATGLRGKPRTLGVQGENLPKVAALLEDPDNHRGQHVLVVGGGDSAVEAAVALCDAGAKVTLSYRGNNFNRAQPKNKSVIARYHDARKIDVLFKSQVTSFDERSVTIALADGGETKIKNDAAFVLIGADPPIAWLEKLGIKYVERPHWWALGPTDQLVESLLGKGVAEAARTAAEAARVVGAQAVAAPAGKKRPPVPEASVVVKMPTRPLERPATVPGALVRVENGVVVTTALMPEDIDAQAARIERQPAEKGMSLEDFARSQSKRKPTKQPRGAEVTRILRSLRDDNARLAYEESSVDLLGSRADQTGASGITLISQVTGLESLAEKDAKARAKKAAPMFLDPATFEDDPLMAPPSHEMRNVTVPDPKPAPRPTAAPPSAPRAKEVAPATSRNVVRRAPEKKPPAAPAPAKRPSAPHVVARPPARPLPEPEEEATRVAAPDELPIPASIGQRRAEPPRPSRVTGAHVVRRDAGAAPPAKPFIDARTTLDPPKKFSARSPDTAPNQFDDEKTEIADPNEFPFLKNKR